VPLRVVSIKVEGVLSRIDGLWLFHVVVVLTKVVQVGEIGSKQLPMIKVKF